MSAVSAEPNGVTLDGRHEKRMNNYTKFWQNDMSKEKDVDTSNRLESYTEVVNGVCYLSSFNLSPAHLC